MLHNNNNNNQRYCCLLVSLADDDDTPANVARWTHLNSAEVSRVRTSRRLRVHDDDDDDDVCPLPPTPASLPVSVDARSQRTN